MRIFGIMLSFLYLWGFLFFLFHTIFSLFPPLYSSLVCRFLSFGFNLFFLNYLYLCFFTSLSPPFNLSVPVRGKMGQSLSFSFCGWKPRGCTQIWEIGKECCCFASSLLQELILSESKGLETGKGSEILARNRKQVTWSSFYPTETWGPMGVPSKCDSKARN